MDITWEPTAPAGNIKYEPMFNKVRQEQRVDPKLAGQWAVIANFESDGTARDTAYRLRKRFEDFEVISRRQGNGTTSILIRYREANNV